MPAITIQPAMLPGRSEISVAGEYQPVFELTRGNIVESTHFGAVAVVDSNGRLLAWYGDPKCSDVHAIQRQTAPGVAIY